MNPVFRLLLITFIAAALAACQRDAEAPARAPEPAVAETPAEAPATPAPIELKDVIESDARYVIGISYPPGIDRHPGLAKALSDYVASARGQLMEAVDGLGNDKPTAPYELSLGFEKTVDTPQWVVVSADGSLYPGGAHGQPLIERFVWQPQQERMLRIEDLIADQGGWQSLSDFINEQLMTGVSLRADADELEGDERARVLKSAARMIEAGTAAKPENFARFVPVLDATGHISALRFVFPPYQVGPYSDGTQTVDVPAAVLRPHITPAYAALFAG